MSTTARQKASRENGALSNGPVSPEGRMRSAQNATRHGLSGGPVVLPTESQVEYDAFLHSYLESFCPRTVAEFDLVRQMAVARWRLRRIEPMETAILQESFERQMEAMGEHADPAKAMQRAYADVAENSKGWRNLSRHQRTLERAYTEAMEIFVELSQRPTAESAAEPKTTNVQNEPEPDYEILKPLYANDAKAARIMPQLLACLNTRVEGGGNGLQQQQVGRK